MYSEFNEKQSRPRGAVCLWHTFSAGAYDLVRAAARGVLTDRLD